MIPRTLVPVGARLSADGVANDAAGGPRRLDERTLVPSGMPLVQLDGRTTIPSNLPLDSICHGAWWFPRDVNVEAVRREGSIPTCRRSRRRWDERISIPVGAAGAPGVFSACRPISEDLVEAGHFPIGEAAFLPPEWRGQAQRPKDRVTTVASVVFSHSADTFLLIFFRRNFFPPHARSNEEEDIARRQMTVLLPPGAVGIAQRPFASPPLPRCLTSPCELTRASSRRLHPTLSRRR